MHRPNLWWVLGTLLVTLTLASEAHAAAAKWYDAFVPTKEKNTVSIKGDVVTWSESSTNDSQVLHVKGTAMCVNTGSTNFTVYASDPTGASKYHIWLGPIQHGVDCSSTTTCGSVQLEAGDYIFDPDATAASATCYSEAVSN